MRLLNEILDFSKIEAGHLHLEQEPFSVRDCTQQAFHLIEPEARRKNLTTGLHIANGVCDRVVGDSHRLRQVLLNLLGNALKFTEAGSLELFVEPWERTADQVVLHFTVVDTGIGIPPEAQEKIFGAFQQADGSTTRKYGGTGLGLAICARLVDLFGGKIWLESTPQTGSKFHFTASFTTVPETQRSAASTAPVTLRPLAP
jgi:signal transduction histidine kinase